MDQKNNKYRIYKIARISDLELLSTTFLPLSNYEVERLMMEMDHRYAATMNMIEVWCNKDSIHFLEEFFLGDQKEEQDDGNFIMRMNLPKDEKLWQALLLVLGDQVKILNPSEYREKLVDTAKKFLMNNDI